MYDGEREILVTSGLLSTSTDVDASGILLME